MDARQAPVGAAGQPRTSWWAVLGLVGLVVAAYGQTMLFDLVRDDHPLYITNPAFRRLPALKEIFASPTSALLPHMAGADRMYRPLLTLSVIADRAVWGVHPGGFHLTSLLLHLAVVVLVWRLAARVSHSRVAAFVSAAIFAVHPSAVWGRIVASLPGVNRTEATEHLRRLRAAASGAPDGKR